MAVHNTLGTFGKYSSSMGAHSYSQPQHGVRESSSQHRQQGTGNVVSNHRDLQLAAIFERSQIGKTNPAIHSLIYSNSLKNETKLFLTNWKSLLGNATNSFLQEANQLVSQNANWATKDGLNGLQNQFSKWVSDVQDDLDSRARQLPEPLRYAFEKITDEHLNSVKDRVSAALEELSERFGWNRHSDHNNSGNGNLPNGSSRLEHDRDRHGHDDDWHRRGRGRGRHDQGSTPPGHGGTPPGHGGGTNPPGNGGGTNPPGDGGGTNPPGDGGGTNPPGNGGDTNPPGNGGGTNPPGNGGIIPPVNQGQNRFNQNNDFALRVDIVEGNRRVTLALRTPTAAIRDKVLFYVVDHVGNRKAFTLTFSDKRIETEFMKKFKKSKYYGETITLEKFNRFLNELKRSLKDLTAAEWERIKNKLNGSDGSSIMDQLMENFLTVLARMKA